MRVQLRQKRGKAKRQCRSRTIACRGAVARKQLCVYDLNDQIVNYKQAWEWQKQYASALAGARQTGQDVPQALAVLQHEPTFTLGTGSSLEHLNFDPADPPFPLFRTERGGEVTYHGPGQLVVYPILDLRDHRQDLHHYLRQLEQVIIDALQGVSGISGHRIDGLTGALPRTSCPFADFSICGTVVQLRTVDWRLLASMVH
jgi:lipoate-protein ligase B